MIEDENRSTALAEFERVLISRREEDVQLFLTKNIYIILNTFGDNWVVNECIPKFAFGNQFISDFVIVTGQSGHYEVTLLELEPPTARPFTQTGNYALRLNGAIRQVTDWLGWIHDNEAYFRKSLSYKMIDRYGRQQITQSKPIFLRAKIIIGRRNMLSEIDNRRRATLFYQHQGRLEIVPYDRLIERIKRRVNDV